MSAIEVIHTIEEPATLEITEHSIESLEPEEHYQNILTTGIVQSVLMGPLANLTFNNSLVSLFTEETHITVDNPPQEQEVPPKSGILWRGLCKYRAVNNSSRGSLGIFANLALCTILIVVVYI